MYNIYNYIHCIYINIIIYILYMYIIRRSEPR